MKVRSGLLVLLLVGCGGRSRVERTESPESPAPNDGSTSSRGLDVGALATERCAEFPLPQADPGFLADGTGFPQFGACGHLTLMTTDPTSIWGPDLTETVVDGARTVSFSSEGSRAIFIPAAPEDDRVRRLDLVTLQAFDTPVPRGDVPQTPAVNFGLFLDGAADVGSWVCSDGDLRIFADRTATQTPVLETTVPSCDPTWRNDATLLWQADTAVFAVDLRGRRTYERALPPNNGTGAALLLPELDGYAIATTSVQGGPDTNGPLYSVRDGSLLAERWEDVLPLNLRDTANRLDADWGLLVDDGTGVTSVPGLLGLYVFRDKKRAFGFQANDGGTAELVFADLTNGATTPIATYTKRVLDFSQSFTPIFGISPHERAACFVVQPDIDPSKPLPTRWDVACWIDGRAEILENAVPADLPVGPGVADDGTAVFGYTAGSVRLRPGTVELTFPRLLSTDVSDDGSVEIDFLAGSDNRFTWLVTNLADAATRTLLSDVSSFTEATDLFHQRFALLLGMNGESKPAHLWAGRFPPPP
jgi:hypothetical protein